MERCVIRWNIWAGFLKENVILAGFCSLWYPVNIRWVPVGSHRICACPPHPQLHLRGSYSPPALPNITNDLLQLSLKIVSILYITTTCVCMRACVRRRFRVLIDWRNRLGQSDSETGNRPGQSDSTNKKSPTKNRLCLLPSCVKTKRRNLQCMYPEGQVFTGASALSMLKSYDMSYWMGVLSLWAEKKNTWEIVENLWNNGEWELLQMEMNVMHK